MAVDLVIRGGTVIDGSGAPGFTADVAIDAGRIVSVGEVRDSGREEIDASGQLVAPGFVDIHTHYDGQVTWDDRLQPSSLHGVTTVVMGNCGVGFAPVKERDRTRLIELMEGVEDIPGTALAEGLKWNWESFEDYLDVIEARPHDVDVAAQIPHGSLRVYVMGERGANRDKATDAEIAQMAALVKSAVQAGALGFSTSRTIAHRTKAGDFTPMLEAEEAELLGIARALKEANAGVIELISDCLDMDDEFPRIRAMAEASGRPMTMSLIQIDMVPDHWKELLKRIGQCNADGIKIKGQVFCRPVGLLLGLSVTIHPFISHPGYREIADLPLAERLAAMRLPARRARILGESPVDPHIFIEYFGEAWEKMFPFGADLNYAPDKRASYAAQAKQRGGSAKDAVYDALLADDGKALVYFPLHNYTDFSLDNVRTMMEDPNTVFGLSDGGAHVASICDASIITYLLTHWCSDDAPGGKFPIEWMIHKQTRQTAETVGLLDRGLLKPGYKADVNIIDFDNLKLHPPHLVNDLPAGGTRFLQTADGYTATILSGEVTYRNGKPTDALPGTLIRGAQHDPSSQSQRHPCR
jgi:N-acyl-D-aspartate/D-glutamate deacylase